MRPNFLSNILWQVVCTGPLDILLSDYRIRIQFVEEKGGAAL